MGGARRFRASRLRVFEELATGREHGLLKVREMRSAVSRKKEDQGWHARCYQ
jgi:hypothetical protein